MRREDVPQTRVSPAARQIHRCQRRPASLFPGGTLLIIFLLSLPFVRQARAGTYGTQQFTFPPNTTVLGDGTAINSSTTTGGVSTASVQNNA
ncbi:MAG TPA: hypothetical protein VFV83_09700, partial [Chthoniobacteraceae bacterium]|nr:hypothetical protein [Chthoniobacteraceae bacterium]